MKKKKIKKIENINQYLPKRVATGNIKTKKIILR
jgi:hypothetical protein